MIETRIFVYDNYDDVNELDDVIAIVNRFIETNHITKTNIMEYRTEFEHFEVNGRTYTRYRITLSYWVDPKKVRK